ncbi:SMP-30/gluconolactonase/LRE family protein [Pseudomonas agarici]|nr:SMP-30/gluconolactonase/LRE family protein [Pseudomonas agarici]
MMYLDHPPVLLETRLFSAMPAEFRRVDVDSAWSLANKGAQRVDSFIEGPCFDSQGNLYVVDIPFGRIFRINNARQWTLVAEYDGEPNGLKVLADGRLLIADYRNGLIELDPVSGQTRPFLSRHNSESFKGINDLTLAANGDIYFTDQGQTGLHDPTGRVFRLSRTGKLDCLCATGISPNGLVLDPQEKVLYVAMTRDNSVWRLPLMADGSVAKVGRFCSLFGVAGPDGLAIDAEGNLLVAHASLGYVFMFAPNGECIARIRSCAGNITTNITFGGPANKQLFITESKTASVLLADMPHPGVAPAIDSTLRAS